MTWTPHLTAGATGSDPASNAVGPRGVLRSGILTAAEHPHSRHGGEGRQTRRRGRTPSGAALAGAGPAPAKGSAAGPGWGPAAGPPAAPAAAPAGGDCCSPGPPGAARCGAAGWRGGRGDAGTGWRGGRAGCRGGCGCGCGWGWRGRSRWKAAAIALGLSPSLPPGPDTAMECRVALALRGILTSRRNSVYTKLYVVNTWSLFV